MLTRDQIDPELRETKLVTKNDKTWDAKDISIKVDGVKKVDVKSSDAPKETKDVEKIEQVIEEKEEKYVHEFYFNKGL